MKVLFVNHTSQVSGGERSLLDLLGALDGRADVAVACPEGPLADAVRARGLEPRPLTGTAGSLRLHPAHTPRALAEMGRAAFQLARLARRERADVVHANSIRAGLVASLAGRLGGRRPVVHVRDVLPDGPVTRATLGVLGRGSAAVVANSAYTAASLDGVSQRTRVRVVHNPVDLTRFDPARYDRAAARRRLDLADGDFAAVVIAQLTPWKGQDDAIRAVARVKEDHPGVRLLLVGAAKFVEKATRFDNKTYVEGLHRLVAELGLCDDVRFLGERDDVPAILAAADAVLLPSWEEPFGRAVVEGMAMGVPVIATTVGGPPEVIDDGADGLLAAPHEPDRWAEALARLIDDRELRARIGQAARERATARFDAGTHASAVLAVYGEVLAGRNGKKTEPGRSRRARR